MRLQLLTNILHSFPFLLKVQGDDGISDPSVIIPLHHNTPCPIHTWTRRLKLFPNLRNAFNICFSPSHLDHYQASLDGTRFGVGSLFTKKLRLAQYADSTIYSYRLKISQAVLHLKKLPDEFTQADVDDYLTMLLDRNCYSLSFFKHTVFGLKDYYKFLD